MPGHYGKMKAGAGMKKGAKMKPKMSNPRLRKKQAKKRMK